MGFGAKALMLAILVIVWLSVSMRAKSATQEPNGNRITPCPPVETRYSNGLMVVQSGKYTLASSEYYPPTHVRAYASASSSEGGYALAYLTVGESYVNEEVGYECGEKVPGISRLHEHYDAALGKLENAVGRVRVSDNLSGRKDRQCADGVSRIVGLNGATSSEPRASTIASTMLRAKMKSKRVGKLLELELIRMASDLVKQAIECSLSRELENTLIALRANDLLVTLEWCTKLMATANLASPMIVTSPEIAQHIDIRCSEWLNDGTDLGKAMATILHEYAEEMKQAHGLLEPLDKLTRAIRVFETHVSKTSNTTNVNIISTFNAISTEVMNMIAARGRNAGRAGYTSAVGIQPL